jgi:16S rRNA processing protein RimM
VVEASAASAREAAAGVSAGRRPAVAGPEHRVAATPDWNVMITVGFVARPHGNAGRVVINPDTDFVEDRFREGGVVYVRRREVERLVLRDVRFHRGRPIVGFDGVTTIPGAEALASAEVRVPPEALGDLPADTFYYHELIGCRVETLGGHVVGAVLSIEGGGDVHRLVIEDASGEVQVPLTAPICVRIDPRERVIVLDPPEGLLDLNRPRRSRGAAG